MTGIVLGSWPQRAYQYIFSGFCSYARRASPTYEPYRQVVSTPEGCTTPRGGILYSKRGVLLQERGSSTTGGVLLQEGFLYSRDVEPLQERKFSTPGGGLIQERGSSTPGRETLLQERGSALPGRGTLLQEGILYSRRGILLQEGILYSRRGALLQEGIFYSRMYSTQGMYHYYQDIDLHSLCPFPNQNLL